MANSQGHEPIVSNTAASVGPAADELATTSALNPMPRPSCARGKMKRTSAVLTLISPAPPSPCTTRATIITGSESASAQASEAAVNTARPIP